MIPLDLYKTTKIIPKRVDRWPINTEVIIIIIKKEDCQVNILPLFLFIESMRIEVEIGYKNHPPLNIEKSLLVESTFTRFNGVFKDKITAEVDMATKIKKVLFNDSNNFVE